MTAPAHVPGPGRRPAVAPGARLLPWWAVALPALAFCALLALTVAGGDADAAQRGSEQLKALLERLQQTFSR